MEKGISQAVKKNKVISNDVTTLITLSSNYIKKLCDINTLKDKKNLLVKKKNYEKASIERNNELIAFGEANSIFKKMKSLRKKINTDSKTKQGTGGSNMVWKFENIKKPTKKKK